MEGYCRMLTINDQRLNELLVEYLLTVVINTSRLAENRNIFEEKESTLKNTIFSSSTKRKEMFEVSITCINERKEPVYRIERKGLVIIIRIYLDDLMERGITLRNSRFARITLERKILYTSMK